MSTDVPRVWVFFYGTFMNVEVLAEHGVTANNSIRAKVNGFELVIRPRVNLISSDRSCVYGGLVAVTHADLERLYSRLQERFGVGYDVTAVLSETQEGLMRPALCYISEHMAPSPADPNYVSQLARCARTLGLPEWYALHIESFA